MVLGIYTSAAGMQPRINQLNNVAHNLANKTTYGYKKESIFLRQLITAQNALDHALGIERTEVPEDVRIDYSQGSFHNTGAQYDIAIHGPGYFRLQDAAGTIFYSRDGNFQLMPNGYLMNTEGMYLLDMNNQPISLTGENVRIVPNGNVFEEDRLVTRIGLADFDPADYPNLNSRGRGIFTRPAVINEIPRDPNAEILQGTLEESNVKSIEEMVSMMELFRFFESGQRSIQIQDQTLNRVVTEVGVVR